MVTQMFIGGLLILTTVVIHAVALELILKVFLTVRMEFQVRFRVMVFALVVVCVFSAHVIEIWVWAVFYYYTAAIAELPTMEAALYFSTSAFTTVGFGDLVLSEDWRLLSSFESTNGMILFGWSTAFIFEVVRHVYGKLEHRAPSTLSR